MAATTYFELERSLSAIIERLAKCKDQVDNGPKRAAAALQQQRADVESIRTDQKQFLDAIGQAAIDNKDSVLYEVLLLKSQQVLSDLDGLSAAAETAIKYIQAIPTS